MKRILITGANRGIGLEMARQYGQDSGWEVHACCRHPETADRLQRHARESGGRVTVHDLDVTDRAAIYDLARELGAKPIDILLNNAGAYGPRDSGLGNVDEKTWRDVFHVNTEAPLRMAEAFADHVASSDRRIIATMSSKMGSIADNSSGGHYIYRSTKAAVNIVMKSLSVDLEDRGITVLVLHPGWVRTDMGGSAAPLSVEQSVTGLRRVLDGAGLQESGRFLAYDGSEVPW